MAKYPISSRPTEICVSADGGEWVEEIVLAPLDAQALRIDLSEVSSARPLLAARLVAAIDMHTRAGTDVQVTPPFAREAGEWLARIGVPTQLQDSSLLELPALRRIEREVVLAPLRCLGRAEEVEPFLERLLEAMRIRLHGPLADSEDAVVLSLSELCDNAISHGASSHGIFVAAQSDGERSLMLVVGDLGVGIPAHLGSAPSDPVDDGRTLRDAIERGTTGVIPDLPSPGAIPDLPTTGAIPDLPSPGAVPGQSSSGLVTKPSTRGIGLARVLDELQRAPVARSLLRIWSATGRLEALLEPHQSPKIAAYNQDLYTAGAWVEIVLQARHP
ncbi:MAG TPA: ATP-binding protein [Solirubrobacteraceae bacterium]|nr:ATP-binding protein [Solirubrobacteraceae bacterium]